MGIADPAAAPSGPVSATDDRPALGTAADLAASLARAADRAPLAADVRRLAVLRFAGADAAAFLHGQLSCHVTELAPGAATWGSYSTPKGRMLASFVLARGAGDEYCMLLDRSIAAAVGKRLRMYVLRAKVTVTDHAADWGVVGVASADPLAIDAGATLRWARLGPSRALGAGPIDAVRQVVAASGLPLVDAAAWGWLDVCDGFPWITAATQDALVPQMANLDRIGGVHFQKGCYPGQEIVARTQYLGQVKRRMVLAHVDAPDAPAIGTPVFGSDLGDQASGLVVDAAPAPGGGFDVLAVMHTSTAAGGTAHVGAADGPRLTLRPLPYALD
jgi:folate-binding protein YgfZ